MRIIAGTSRGMRLRTVELDALRPMLDRVKESLFGILRDVVPESSVLDLFSGSGSLGLEALSRGATACVFVEQDAALVQLMRDNAAKCRLTDRCRFVQADVLALAGLRPPAGTAPAGLVFVDPPYAVVEDPNGRSALFAAMEALMGPWAAPGALWVLHHSPMPYAVWPTQRLRQTDRRIYGRSQLTFLEAAEGEP